VAQLTTLTAQVAANNRFSSTESSSDAAVMAAVRQGIQHVIFIIKENRTYDQILGDLKDASGNPIGNGDPALTEFGEAITPNHHGLARTFVTLDTLWTPPKSAMTAGRGPLRRKPPTWWNTNSGGLRGARPEPGRGGDESQCECWPFAPERQLADPFTSADPDVLPGHTDAAAPDGRTMK